MTEIVTRAEVEAFPRSVTARINACWQAVFALPDNTTPDAALAALPAF